MMDYVVQNGIQYICNMSLKIRELCSKRCVISHDSHLYAKRMTCKRVNSMRIVRPALNRS
jgi:hypothetical protein